MRRAVRGEPRGHPREIAPGPASRRTWRQERRDARSGSHREIRLNQSQAPASEAASSTIRASVVRTRQ